MASLWGRIDGLEKDAALDVQREPDLGFAWAAYRWASGHRLEAVLSDAELQAGDFVRWVKQLLDLLGQVADAAPEDSGVRAAAREAVSRLRRGVVAYTSMS
jgi:ATP-dependent RNA helicase HelY